MSTRSGKRIHASIHENVKSQRKSRRQKENEEINTTLSKRNNYVSYPKEDNLVETDDIIDQKLPKRKRRKTLNQHNHNIEATDMNTTMVRQTRSNKKINNITEVALESDRNIEVVNGKIKPKKSKRKTENKKNGKENINTVTQTKSKSKKKKGKQSLEAESNIVEVVNSNAVHNQSNESVDSYHSANACSPRQINVDIPSLTTDFNAKADNGSNNNTLMDVSNAFFTSPSQTLNGTFDKSNSYIKNSTFDNINISKENLLGGKCKLSGTSDKNATVSVSSTYDKLDVTFDKNSKSSLDTQEAVNCTYDKSNSSHISIGSDQSIANIILNDTPMNNENSLLEKCIKPNKISDDESLFSSDFSVSEKSSSPKNKPQSTPLKREGTFTIEGQDPVIISSEHKVVMRPSSPGSTPFHSGAKKVAKEKNKINLTRSIEKRAKSPRSTKVMFCSPANNPTVLSQRKSKVIKSNLKGSNKSFVFDGDESMSINNQVARNCKSLLPRSYADRKQAKRKRLADDQQESVLRLSKPRTPNVKSSEATKRDPNKSSTKLPNFSALHRKQFAKMESLVDCQQRKAERARRLLASGGGLDKSATKASSVSSQQNGETNPIDLKPPDVKSGYTRFGFKLNTSVNPFNVTTQSKPKDPLVPSTVGATVTSSNRRQVAMKAALREKSSKSLRISMERNENRTVIKGVRTNRRFELQMKARNLQLA